MTTHEALLQVQIDWLGVAAAIAGAVIAGARGYRSDQPARQWATSTMIGVGVGIFCGPYLAEQLSMTSTKSSMFVHFGMGLIGYQFVDTLADKLWAWVVSKLPVKPDPIPPPPDAPKG